MIPLIFMDIGDSSTCEARCPKCGTSYLQQAVMNSNDQRCPFCGVCLETKNSYHNGTVQSEIVPNVMEYKSRLSMHKDTVKEDIEE